MLYTKDDQYELYELLLGITITISNQFEISSTTVANAMKSAVNSCMVFEELKRQVAFLCDIDYE